MSGELPHEMTLDDTYLRKGRGVIDLTRNGLTWFSKRWPSRRHSQGGYTNKSKYMVPDLSVNVSYAFM